MKLLRWMVVFLAATATAQQTVLVGSNVNGHFTPWTSSLTSGQVPTPPSFLAKCKNGALIVDCPLNGGGGSFSALTGDATSTSSGGATQVIGLLNHALPSLTSGFLNWTGSAWALSPASGLGTVTSVSVVTANGISGSVASATTTPAITLTLGAITPTSTNGVSAATMAFNDATSSIQTQLNAKGVGTVTSIATTGPITGGTITGTGTIACATCVVASSPGLGIAHFAGSTQTVTSSLIVAADITSNTITGTQLAASLALVTPNIGAATGTSLLATGNVDGTAPVTVTTGTTATLGGTFKSGYTDNQEATAATAVAYTLPTAAAGLQYCIDNSWNGTAATTGVLTLNTSASGQFIIFTDGTLTATGGNVTSGGAAADSACVRGVDATHWQLYVQRGTWTKH